MSSILPICLSLVLCDTVIEDARTRNKSLINMFNGVLSPMVPVRHDKMCAFASFTGGRGEVPIALRLSYDNEFMADLLRLGGSIKFDNGNPQAVVDIVFEIRGFVFRRFGSYTFELLAGAGADETSLLTRRFTVSQAQTALGGPGEAGRVLGGS